MELYFANAVSNATLDLDLAIIDSWDGDVGETSYGGRQPDIFNVRFDGAYLFSRTFNNATAPTTGAGLTTTVFSEDLAVNFYFDSAYHLTLNLANVGSGTKSLEFFANGVGFELGYESFAIDNVTINGTVQQTPVPEPGSLILVLTGICPVMAFVRRQNPTPSSVVCPKQRSVAGFTKNH